MRNKLVSIAAAAMMLSAGSALAHHPFQAEFDWKKPVTITGTITKIDWKNPHVALEVAGKDAKGAPAKWQVELGSPTALAEYGWSQTLLKSGERITIDGWQAMDGSLRANAKSVTAADGRVMFAASSFFDVRQQVSVPNPAGVTGTKGVKPNRP
jgi:Family of unknown function (DUF6152)